MALAKSLFRSISAIISGSFASLILFGLALSFLWAVGDQTKSSKLVSVLLAFSFAFYAGGFVVAWMVGSARLALPCAFGFLLGGCSLTYLFGPSAPALGLTAVAVLMAMAGSLVYRFAILECAGTDTSHVG